MLHAAGPADLDFIRSVIHDSAADGSFDPELAGDSLEAQLFFANLAQALRSGFFVQPDANGDPVRTARVAGYTYAPAVGARLSGCGIFKDIGDGTFELWLTGIPAACRHLGHGRAMLRELLATPAGGMTCVVRCSRRSSSGAIAARLFREFGFALCRATPAMLWLANAKASPALLTRIVAAPAASA